MRFVTARENGFTLIELIATVVVLSIVAASLLGVYAKGVARSADPMLSVQGVAIAQGYLEEALLKAFQDPDQAETGSCEEGAAVANRQNYDDVQDYNCINDLAGALDQFGNPLVGLASYNVSMNVSATTLGPGGQQAAAQQVVVTVTHDSYPVSISLTGFRTNY